MELTKIADWLLLNGTLTKCPGLLHGKLGIAIFFFHYARYTGKTLFEEYAWDLIMAIQEQLHVNYRPDYENDKMIFCDSLLSQFLLKFNQLRISLFPMELTKSP